MSDTTTPALATKATKATKAKKTAPTPSEDVEAVLNTFKAESEPAPPKPAPTPSGDDSDDEEAELLRQLAEHKRKKAEREGLKNIEALREAKRETIRQKVKDLEAKRETIDRQIAECGDELNSIDRGNYDTELIKGLGDRAEKIKVVAETATVKRTPTANGGGRGKVERREWIMLTTYPLRIRFNSPKGWVVGSVLDGKITDETTGETFYDPSAWCAKRNKQTRNEGSKTSKSIYAVGFCQLTAGGEWVRLCLDEKDYNF